MTARIAGAGSSLDSPLRLLVTDAELEVRVGPPARVEDTGGFLPAIEVHMPPYMAARLAHLLDQWASVCDLTGSDEGVEWVAAADALLRAARSAAPERDDPEFRDLAGVPRPRSTRVGSEPPRAEAPSR